MSKHKKTHKDPNIEINEKHFCENVKYLRAKYKLTKKEMSNILGISVRSLNLIEQEIIPPRLRCDIIFNLYDKFGITPSTLFSCCMCNLYSDINQN